MQQTVLAVTDALEPTKEHSLEKENAWQNLPNLIRKRLNALLSDEYLQDKKIETRLKVKNPWGIPPSMNNIDWLVNTKSKHCIILTENASQPKHEVLA